MLESMHHIRVQPQGFVLMTCQVDMLDVNDMGVLSVVTIEKLSKTWALK